MNSRSGCFQWLKTPAILFAGSLLTLSTGLYAQEDLASELARLRAENARLREQIAATEEAMAAQPPAVAEPAQPAQPEPVTTVERTAPQAQATARIVQQGDEEVVVMSPFEVSSEKDFGYRLTNSLTATRIGASIQETPLSISVLGDEFLQDTKIQNLQETLRFIPTASGDNQQGILQPQTGFTPSGRQSIRGFPVDAIMRNSVRRYTLFTNDNVERIEVIQGPASVFFGQAFPGGVINYITKKPVFADLPTTLRWELGLTRTGNKFTYDDNSMLTDNIALRVVGAYENMKGHRDYEFRKGYTVMPSLTVRATDWVTLNLEVEFSGRTQNFDNYTWIWPAQWFADYENPSVELMQTGLGSAYDPEDPAGNVAAYRSRIGGGSGINGNWINDVRNAAGDQYIPRYTAFREGPVAERLSPKDFNTFGKGYSQQDVRNFEFSVDLTPTEWFSARFLYNNSDAVYFENRSQSRPNVDGNTLNHLVGWTYRDYRRKSEDFVLDTVFTWDINDNFKNKFLVGGIYRENINEFGGTPLGRVNPDRAYSYDGLPDPGGTMSEYTGIGDFRQIPGSDYFSYTQLQTKVDRNGDPMKPFELFTKYDPSIHPYPDITRVGMPPRALLDRYEPKQDEWYASYQGDLFNDTLHLMLGYRDEKNYNGAQVMSANPPWLGYVPDMLETIPPDQWPAYQISESYARSTRIDESGESWMFGAAYDVNDNVTVYGSVSQSYKPNGGNQAIYDEANVLARADQLGLDPQAELARIKAEGADNEVPNEQGRNMEVGVKISTQDSKITGTIALFSLERKNQRKEDLVKQQDEPLNYLPDGTYSRQVRWFSTEATWKTEGASLDVVWTPIQNYQALISAGWMWTAEVTEDPSILPSNINWKATFEGRIPNAPEYTASIWNKYTFTEGGARGLTLGGGIRYKSEVVIANNRDWDPNFGGLSAGDYVVVDLLVGYAARFFDIDWNFALNINNAFDAEYSEGGWNYAPPRDVSLTTTMQF